MTVPTSNRLDGVLAAGASTGASGLVPFVTSRAPSSSDITGPYGPWKLGQVWVSSLENDSYTLTSLTSFNGVVTATWKGSVVSGFMTLVGSSPFVLNDAAIKGSSVILFTIKTLGTVTVPSFFIYTTTAAQASLTVSQPTDTSTYGYAIFN